MSKIGFTVSLEVLAEGSNHKERTQENVFFPIVMKLRIKGFNNHYTIFNRIGFFNLGLIFWSRLSQKYMKRVWKSLYQFTIPFVS